GKRGRHAARHAGFTEELAHIRTPEFEDLHAGRLGRVGWAGGAAGGDVDGDAAMQRADTDGRFAGDVPGVDAMRTPDVGQVATFAADRDLRDSRRRNMRRCRLLDAREVDSVGDAEEQWRGGVDADEAGVALAGEVANPDHEHVGSDDAGGPGIAESPGR